VADRDLVNDGGLDLWRHGRAYTSPFGSAAGASWTHVQGADVGRTNRAMPGEQCDPRLGPGVEPTWRHR
jgi:hypothetical protein